MCSHYQAIEEREQHIGELWVEPPAEPGKVDLWPEYLGSLIRSHPHTDVGYESTQATEAVSGMFGSVPHWATDTKIARKTYNARSEAVSEKPGYRDAWKRAQHCIMPAVAI